MRGRGESHSDVILRLVRLLGKKRKFYRRPQRNARTAFTGCNIFPVEWIG
jgi:hypothetical protein